VGEGGPTGRPSGAAAAALTAVGGLVTACMRPSNAPVLLPVGERGHSFVRVVDNTASPVVATLCRGFPPPQPGLPGCARPQRRHIAPRAQATFWLTNSAYGGMPGGWLVVRGFRGHPRCTQLGGGPAGGAVVTVWAGTSPTDCGV
jgi:hypothetical protein